MREGRKEVDSRDSGHSGTRGRGVRGANAGPAREHQEHLSARAGGEVPPALCHPLGTVSRRFDLFGELRYG
jgi:hypothetical protein